MKDVNTHPNESWDWNSLNLNLNIIMEDEISRLEVINDNKTSADDEKSAELKSQRIESRRRKREDARKLGVTHFTKGKGYYDAAL